MCVDNAELGAVSTRDAGRLAKRAKPKPIVRVEWCVVKRRRSRWWGRATRDSDVKNTRGRLDYHISPTPIDNCGPSQFRRALGGRRTKEGR